MVDGTGNGRLHARVKAGEFWIDSGVDKKDGGHGDAPSPHALLEASLASCTILTLELYAARKSWALGEVKCQVRVESEGATGTKIARVITFESSVSAEMRERLEVIANKCPIHRLLSGSVVIHTSVN